jgi:hypothetical protein
VIEMSIDKKPDKKKTAVISKEVAKEIKEAHKKEFKEHQKELGEPISKEAVKKLENLIPILRKDAKKLGIHNLTVQIVPEKDLDYVASIGEVGYNVIDDGVVGVPGGIQYGLLAVENLTEKELRAMAWHEFGHLIYGYFFPKSYDKDEDDIEHYTVQETFCDEFAYKKFGDVMLSAQLKLTKLYGDPDEKDDILVKINAMRTFKKRYGKDEYWLSLADTYGIRDEIVFEPYRSHMIGVRPSKRVLKGMYFK